MKKTRHNNAVIRIKGGSSKASMSNPTSSFMEKLKGPLHGLESSLPKPARGRIEQRIGDRLVIDTFEEAEESSAVFVDPMC